ncbi:MAG: nucleotide sugar dehydrogenase [Chloroflexota bacterium]
MSHVNGTAKERDYDVVVVGGGGHVGLPLAMVFADKGLRTLVYDINEETVETIRGGVVPFAEGGAEDLLAKVLATGRFHLTTDPAEIARSRNVVITIGTPVDEFSNPVLGIMRDMLEQLVPYLDNDQLIVLRSTVYPGTTEWMGRHMEDEYDLTPWLAFCPERVVQGKAIEEVQSLPQIISGTTEDAAKAAGDLFSLIVSELVFLEPTEAEFAKLFNNAWRYIQFAVANQFYMMTEAAGVDYYRVLNGMKHNYSRALGIPGAGFAAGPCLYKDTMQLSAFSNNTFSIGHAAMLVNEGMVNHVVDQIAQEYDIENLKVGLLGMAFKANIDDIRSSLSYKLKKLLEFRARKVYTTDDHVTVDPSLLPLDEVIEKSDLLILCVPHGEYRDLDTKGKPMIDIWGYVEQIMPISTVMCYDEETVAQAEAGK